MEWIIWSNPVVDVLGELNKTGSERQTIARELERLVQERNGGGPVVLTNPINTGIGMK